MRFFCITFLVSAGVFAQIATPPQAKPVPDDAVVASVDGKKYTARDVRAMTDTLPAQAQQGMTRDPIGGLQQLLMFRFLASEAEKEQLDKQSPLREELAFQRMITLATAEINRQRGLIAIPADDQEKYYREHASDFQQAKVRVIYVAFRSGQVKSDREVLTESEAKAKIQDLRKQLLAGEDFGKLAKENSDDKESAAKEGEWGVVKGSANYPAEIKNAVFSLKAGGISEPVKQANGYYIFKVDEFQTQPYVEVSTHIADKLRQQRQDEWFKGLQKRFAVMVENKDFFPGKQAAPASR